MLVQIPLRHMSKNIAKCQSFYVASTYFHTSTVSCHRIDRRSAEERSASINKYRFIPSKYRVAMSAYQKTALEKLSGNSSDQIWSDGSKTHPLPESPLIDYPQPLPERGLQYYGFEYYPPPSGEIESIPEEEISPLFMVQRVKRMKGIEWYYKDILQKLGLGKEYELSEVVIVKNIPEMNAILYSVKHLIKITPVQLPSNLSLDVDPSDCFLSEEGVFTHEPARAIPDVELEVTPEREAKRLDPITIKKQSIQNFYSAWELVP